MKKLFKLFSVICAITLVIACFASSFVASAAIPTSLTFTQVSKAPAIDAAIDDVYGKPVFDYRATDTPIGEWNVFPRDNERMTPVMDAYNAMRVAGYVVFDKDYLYMAYDVYDVAPKVADNSTKFYKSTNLQLVFFVNENLGYITAAYAGTNSVRVFNDDGNRSTMTIDNIECKLTEKSKTNYIYEMRIPWSNFHEVEKLSDITDFKFAITQTSMGSAGKYKNDEGKEDSYVCSAFGKAYDLNYDSSIPVTLQKLAADKKEENKNETSKETGSVASSDSGAVGEGVEFGETSEDKTTSSTNQNSSKDTATTSTQSNAGTDSATGTDSETGVESTTGTASADEQTTTGTVTTEEKDYTLIIILAIVAVVVVAGGILAIVLINKGGKE